MTTQEGSLTDCIAWTGAMDRDGYGRDGIEMAHRVAYQRVKGPIPEGLEIDHLCRNRACVNADHMEPVTHAENMRRSVQSSASRTHCVHGHEYTPANTYLRRGGPQRDCRACGKTRTKRYIDGKKGSMNDMHSPGGKARAATATRGNGGQFLPAADPAETQRQRQHDPSSSKYLKISLKSLHLDTEWWDALGNQYPGVNLHAELLKALDWHRADRVKSPKLFFRNWVERAHSQLPRVEEELTLAQVRARLRVVS